MSTITSNFNGTAIPAGDYIWFNSVAKVSGVPSGQAVTLHATNESVTYTVNHVTTTIPLPDADITFSPTATMATTTFNGKWTTTVPTNPGGNVFLGGTGVQFPGGLPGGANPVNWTASFSSDTAGLKVNWQWAAAVYKNFADNSNLGVKPVDSNSLSQYQNSDHAGTPENFKGDVTGGARGGGGSNWTGSYSATASFQPTVETTANLAGTVYDSMGNPVGAATITLTDSNNNQFQVTTNPDGTYSIDGLMAGSYSFSVVDSTLTMGTSGTLSLGTGDNVHNFYLIPTGTG